MSFLFKLILVIIFIYLIYRISFLNRAPKDPYTTKQDTEPDVKTDPDGSVEKKIDMSKVEDADYKEIK